MSKNDEEDGRTFTLAAHVSEETYRLVKLLAALRGSNISTLIAAVIENHVESVLTEEQRTTLLGMGQ